MPTAAQPTVAINLTLQMPDTLAREAQASGLLPPRAELRRRRVNQLFAAADRLADVDLPPLTEADVEAEIQAVRAARRNTPVRGYSPSGQQ
jgi:hypothetical protein